MASQAPTLPSSSNPKAYVVRVDSSSGPLREPASSADATAIFYGPSSSSAFERSRSMSSASRTTALSAARTERERTDSGRSGTARNGLNNASSRDKLIDRQNFPYSYPHSSHSGVSLNRLPNTSMHSLQGSQSIQSQSHTPHIHPRPSFLQAAGSTAHRSPTDRSFGARASSGVSREVAIPMSSLGRRPSGRSVLSSHTGAGAVHVIRRPNDLSGYQSDGYMSDGARSGYNSDGARSGYQSDSGRARRMLPIGPDRPLMVSNTAPRREPERAAGDRRSWDQKWQEGVDTLGIGRGAGEKKRKSLIKTDIQEEADVSIGFGMVVPEEESNYGEPQSPQEPARSQFLAEARQDEEWDRPLSQVQESEPPADDEEASVQRNRSLKQAHFAPLPPPEPVLTQSDSSRTAQDKEKSVLPLTISRSPPRKNYKTHPSRNGFYFGGRILTGGDDPWPFIGSVVIVFAIGAIWLAGVGSHCGSTWGSGGWAILAVGSYGIALVIASMMVTAFRDPGIIPRNLDENPPIATSSITDGDEPIALPRDLRARSGIVRVKWCTTCKTYRPPRSSHCKVCDNCVDGIDHHCTYLHNCVGRRNYTTFITFLVSAVLTLCLVIVTSALELYHIASSEPSGFVGSLRMRPLAAVAFAMGIIVIWPMSILLAYHVRLQVLNITTVEQVRAQAHRSMIPGPIPPNAFDLGRWYYNVASVLCRPGGYSWLQPAKLSAEDRRLPNPGYGERREGWGSRDR